MPSKVISKQGKAKKEAAQRKKEKAYQRKLAAKKAAKASK